MLASIRRSSTTLPVRAFGTKRSRQLRSCGSPRRSIRDQAHWQPSGRVVPAGAHYAHHVIGAEDFMINMMIRGTTPLAMSAWDAQQTDLAARSLSIPRSTSFLNRILGRFHWRHEMQRSFRWKHCSSSSIGKNGRHAAVPKVRCRVCEKEHFLLRCSASDPMMPRTNLGSSELAGGASIQLRNKTGRPGRAKSPTALSRSTRRSADQKGVFTHSEA